MRRTASAAVVGVVAAFALAGCSISIGSTGPRTPAVSPATRPAGSSSTTAAGANYLAFVAPANTATFSLDTAVFGSTDDLTTQSLSAVVGASAASIQTFDDHLRTSTWPRTAEPDITTLAATNDVLVVVLQGYESELGSPKPGADFNAVLNALQDDGSKYAIDRGLATDAAARVRADLGLPPPSAPQVSLND